MPLGLEDFEDFLIHLILWIILNYVAINAPINILTNESGTLLCTLLKDF